MDLTFFIVEKKSQVKKIEITKNNFKDVPFLVI